MQSRPAQAANELRSLRDIQAEEAELQAEVEFMKWWTAEEERIRLENEAVAASLLAQSGKQRHQRQHKGRRGKTPASAAPADGRAPGSSSTSSSSRGQKTPRGGGEGKRRTPQRVPSSGGKSASGCS